MVVDASDRRPTSLGNAGPRPPSVGGQPPARAMATVVDGTVVALEGDLDLPAADRLRALLQDTVASRRQLVLDLSSVTHVCPTALAVLVAGHRRLRDAGGALVVRSPSDVVVRELRISGLHRVLVVDPPQPGLPGPRPA